MDEDDVRIRMSYRQGKQGGDPKKAGRVTPGRRPSGRVGRLPKKGKGSDPRKKGSGRVGQRDTGGQARRVSPPHHQAWMTDHSFLQRDQIIYFFIQHLSYPGQMVSGLRYDLVNRRISLPRKYLV